VSPADRKRWRGFRRMWWIRLLLPVWIERIWLLAVTGLVVVALVSFSDQQDDLAALTVDIQEQRAMATFDACADQNDRHDQTIARLNTIIDALPAGPRRRRAQRNVGGTIALIDALVPHQDCASLVRRRVPRR
jgi:hypothetical protein